MPPPPWKRDGADLGCKCLKVMTSGRVAGWHALGSARAVCDIELARPQSRDAFAGFSLGRNSLRRVLRLQIQTGKSHRTLLKIFRHLIAWPRGNNLDLGGSQNFSCKIFQPCNRRVTVKFP